jgi:hypothetical protein
VTFALLQAVDWIALVSAQSPRSDVEQVERALEEPVREAPWKAMA